MNDRSAADDWVPWQRAVEPGALLRYVPLPDTLGWLRPALPGRSGQPRVARLAAVYGALANPDTPIRYVHEPDGSGPAGQYLRPADQVLARPGDATCLDLVVVAAGACLRAGLHPLVVILDPIGARAASHAVLLVWLGGDWAGGPDPEYPGEPHQGEVLLPAHSAGQIGEILADLATSRGGAGAFLPVDVAAAAVTGAGVPAGFDEAVAAAVGMLTDTTAWRWGLGVDVGLGWTPERAQPSGYVPAFDVLAKPYLPADGELTPLQRLKPVYNQVPFLGRSELDLLLAWCQAPVATSTVPGRSPTRIAVVHGVGGAGKTHLAAELAHRLATEEGWYTGFLAAGLTGADRRWLGRVVAPLLVVIDYAEDLIGAAVDRKDPSPLLELARQLRGRPASSPACVLLTARSAGGPGGWWDTLQTELTGDRHPFTTEVRGLPRHHPHPVRVFNRAFRAFAQRPATIEPPAGNRARWTTLDLVLLADLAARGTPRLPATPEKLYDEILDLHELPYWARFIAARHPPVPAVEVLAQAGAVVTLFSPAPARVQAVLAGVVALADDAPLRASLAADLIRLLPGGSAQDGVAIRPDPVGHHLMLRELTVERDLTLPELTPNRALARRFLATVTHRDEYEDDDEYDARVTAELSVAYANLTRAYENRIDLAQWLADLAMADQGRRWWPAAYHVTVSHGGPFVRGLETLAAAPDTPLPLGALAAGIPLGHGALRQLAAIAADRVVQALSGAQPADNDLDARRDLAGSLNNQANRLSEVGRREDALTAITEAVTRYRQLADANPAAFTPNLAMSLNNQANQLSEVGRREDALTAITEAVTRYRQLADANPAAFTPDLAASLNNQANRLSEVGRREDALTAITEAVTRYRQLADANPAAFTPDLAASLNNQANRLSEVGRREDALTAITEAVTLRRQLADANPAAFTPDLAGSLNNQAAMLSEVGRREDALTAITEAVTRYRQLADANPAAFTPDLAASLNNQAAMLSEVGRREDALTAITEAVTRYRQLADANPAAFTPDLAMSLNNQAAMLSEVGRREDALTAITEAVTRYRQLADANPAAFTPNLAMSLNNQANQLSEVGRREDALTAITEAVTRYRQLADANPAAFTPNLAMSLNNQANQLSEVGRREDALTAITEAVTRYRQLADANPAAFTPNLAASLNNQANQLSEVGRREDALTAITEAVTRYRQLADANPAAFTPNLAASLNNQANQLSEVGRREDALTAITEAVTLRRQLADANPAAFTPDLAASLNNQANRLSEVGRREDALTAITEAVTRYRQLADANPAAFTPNLAASLNNQAAMLSEVGRREDALTAITEAVTRYRQLADANPAAFTPDLAGSLNNQANRLSEVGRREDALTAITEAVTLRRQLADANPAAFTPDLAGSLNNQAAMLSEVGRREDALTAITEAVTRYRQLADANPAAFTPNLAASLNNQAAMLSEVGRREDALTAITEAVTRYRQLAETNPFVFLSALTSSLASLATWLHQAGRSTDAAAVYDNIRDGLPAGTQAEILCARHAWHRTTETGGGQGGDGGTADDLIAAAALADADDDPERAGSARRAVRAHLTAPGTAPTPGPGPDLPDWATSPVDDQAIEATNRWTAATTPGQREAALRHTHALAAASPGARRSLTVVAALFPDHAAPDELLALLSAADREGIDAVAAEIRAADDRRALLTAWIKTPTWDDSYRYAAAHPGLLTDPACHAMLETGRDDPVVAQHLGITRLAARMPLTDVYGVVTDLTEAIDAALDGVENGHPDAISDIFMACPDLLRIPFVTPFVAAVLAALSEDPDTATQLATLAATQSSADDRATATTRLRRLARRRPDLGPTVASLIAILDAPSSSPGDEAS